MIRTATITSIRFRNFKAFDTFSLSIHDVNVLVGPNNSGKSTILGACRLLAGALRHARAKSAEWVDLPSGDTFAYKLPEYTIPISLENVHTNYNDDPSTIDFRISNGNKLRLYFTGDRKCYLLPISENEVRRPSEFRREYPLTIEAVPVLGPLEHNEPIVEEETVRSSLQTHRASRHFRNYWRYYPDGFQEFAEMIRRTWPGMDIRKPEKPDMLSRVLQMFCTEERMSRELYWAGFGFQIWCQLLSHICRAKDASLIIIDEPEIYLHPDVQRQLLGILRDLGPDILIATHSTEIMTEADPSEIILVDKNRKSAKRVKDIEGVQQALDSIGSIQNITLTRLARNRRVLFVEGLDDFNIIRRFAKRAGRKELASAVDITPVESKGFSSWERIESLAWGINRTLGRPILLT